MSVPSNLTNPNIIVIYSDEAVALKLWMIGVILSAFVYGGVFFLSLSYVPLLLKTSSDISRRMRNFLLVYVAFMVTIGGIDIITTSISLTRTIFQAGDSNTRTIYSFQNEFVGALCTIFASWGADGFMV